MSNLNRLVKQLLYYLAANGLIAIVLYLSFTVTVIVSRQVESSLLIFLWTVILALVLAFVTPLLWQFSRRLFARMMLGEQERDVKKLIRHYSQSVSSALDMQRLGDTVLSLMKETFDPAHGLVFVNERGETGVISLRPISYVGNLTPTKGILSIDSPFIDCFRKGKKYLHQAEIDTAPTFQDLREEERDWLAAMKLIVYIPIMRHRDFVGLLAFGPQKSGTDYVEDDLDLMSVLADQMAMAMDGARLFERLASVSQEYGSLTEQMDGLDKSKTDFLSIASHELRTPLTHIHGYSRMLMDLSDEEFKDPSFVRTVAEGVFKGSERMKNIIDVIFDVTEVNVGEISLFLGPVNLGDVIERAVQPYLTALDDRRMAFGKTGFEELPIIEADGTRLIQAFENLINNAIKYTPDGGLITIKARPVVMDKVGSAVEILVTDNGIGVDPEYHERIFDKFFRVGSPDHHSTGKTKFKGAGPGLGLTLVKGIVEAHGGRVWVESSGYDEAARPGSNFFVLLPLHPVSNVPQDIRRQSQIETVHWRSKDMKTAKD